MRLEYRDHPLFATLPGGGDCRFYLSRVVGVIVNDACAPGRFPLVLVPSFDSDERAQRAGADIVAYPAFPRNRVSRKAVGDIVLAFHFHLH